jgi:hypothetical protein
LLRSTCEASTSDYKDKNMNTARLLLLLAFCSTAALTQAQTVVPHTFQDGTPAEASEVNENFDALAESIDEGWGGRFVFKSAGEVLGFAFSEREFVSRQGYHSYLFRDTGTIAGGDVSFQSADCSGPAYYGGADTNYPDSEEKYRGKPPGFVFVADGSSYWAVPHSATLQVVTLNSELGYWGEGDCYSYSVPLTALRPNVVPNDPAVTGIQNKGAQDGEVYAWPIIVEML